ncbi:MAG: glutamate racemase [Candidatus Glassbacteria bacterium]
MIGIFDSGVGGLAIQRQIGRFLPRIDIAYLADTAAFPYGPKTPEFIIDRTARISRALIERGARLIVVACNTATVVAIESLRRKFNLPFVGVEPAVKVAAELAPADGPIYVLLTQNSALGRKYTELVRRVAGGRPVRAVCLDLLAEVVEDGSFTRPEVRQRIEAEVREAVGEPPEGSQVVLGCTHYVFLRELFQEIFGPGVNVLEPSLPVAEQVVRVVKKLGIPVEESGRREYLSTGDPEAFALRLRLLTRESPGPSGVLRFSFD